MKEYIEREAVLVYPIRKDHCDKENANEHFIFGIESVMEYVEDLPSADVAPVRHAHWFDVGSLSRRCSGCGCKNDRETAYCPNCGAKMQPVGNPE